MISAYFGTYTLTIKNTNNMEYSESFLRDIEYSCSNGVLTSLKVFRPTASNFVIRYNKKRRKLILEDRDNINQYADGIMTFIVYIKKHKIHKYSEMLIYVSIFRFQ